LEASSICATIYTRAEIWQQVGLQPNEFSGRVHLITDRNSLPKFFRSFLNEINQSDLVLFNTLDSDFRVFSNLDIVPPTIVRVHNANTFGRPWTVYRPFSDPGVSWLDLPKIIRQSFRATDLGALARVLERATYLLFPNASITEYVLREQLFDESKVVRNPPWLSHAEVRERPGRDPRSVLITVPGSIDPRRRDYDLLVRAFRSAIPRLECNVELTLLGRPKSRYARAIVDQVRSLECTTFRLITFDEFVSNEAFAVRMDRTDFLILPISPVMCHRRIFLERYGYTKASGSVSDMIRFGLPAIIPNSYPLTGAVHGIAAFYADEFELADLIVNWVVTRSFEKLDTVASLSDYSLPQATKSLEETLVGLLARTIRAPHVEVPD
jgi:hypothetical protein